jgi:hypothetical protein
MTQPHRAIPSDYWDFGGCSRDAYGFGVDFREQRTILRGDLYVLLLCGRQSHDTAASSACETNRSGT